MLQSLILCAVALSPQRAPSPAPKEMRFVVVEQGSNYGAKKAEARAIRDTKALDAFLKARREPDRRAYANLNWAKDQVIVVHGGEVPTGGYRVEVKRVLVDRSATVVEARIIRPRPNTIVTQALTYPYAVVKTARTSGAVSVRFLTDEKG
jgi:hypothetical protein